MNVTASILLVDDQKDFLENVSLTLESAGYNTLVAVDGYEALDALTTNPVNLILSDIGMPEMGGYQLYQCVRKNPHWSKIPFVFLTGYEFLSENEVFYGKTLGISKYLTKPIRAVELLIAVENTLYPVQ